MVVPFFQSIKKQLFDIAVSTRSGEKVKPVSALNIADRVHRGGSLSFSVIARKADLR